MDGEVEVKVNGEKQGARAKPQGYLTLTRTWKDGDVIEYRLPMKVHLYKARDDNSVVALLYGPVVLTGMWGNEFLPDSEVCRQAHHQCFQKENFHPVPVLLAGAGDPSMWVK